MKKKSYLLGEIATILGAKLTGNPERLIDGVASLDSAKEGQVSFLGGARYQLIKSSRHEKFLSTTQASAVLVSPLHAKACPVDKLIIEDPHSAYLTLAKLFEKQFKKVPGIHPTAVIGSGCEISATASIGPYCVIGENCRIGENTSINSHAVIKDNVSIGKDVLIASHVVLYHDVLIGDRVVIHAGAIIGKEGFGMVRSGTGWEKIPHLGTVILEDDVEIGCNTTIDRGALDNTLLKKGVKLDNQIQVGHGVVIGENTIIAGCTGIAGSTRIGKNCMIGGAVAINDNITICDNVIFTAMAGVSKSITQPGIYSSGTGIQPQKDWHRSIACLRKLAKKAKKMENKQYE
jgi:UDP-3-O-[3-hydroxymyristoyl] glucosamine N-acyltransferase